MGAGDYSDSAGWWRGLTLAYSIGILLGLWLDWVCWFSADISEPGAAQRKSWKLLRTGVGEINQGGWKFLSVTERQQQPRLGGRSESGNSGLACCCFRNLVGCKWQLMEFWMCQCDDLNEEFTAGDVTTRHVFGAR